MDRKHMCVANVQYHKPSASGGSRNLLNYLTYRNGRFEDVRQKTGKQRWVDRGMGRSVPEIAQRCQQMQSDHVLMFSLVINPNPDLIALIPAAKREQVVKEVTEQVIEQFFEARGIDTGVEYSYVVHHRSTEGEAPGQHNPHTHVVLPGTFFSEADDQRVPLYFSQNQQVNHIEMLHRITEDTMEGAMDRYVGRDWERQIDTLHTAREREFAITQSEPHAYEEGDEGVPQPVWIGTRRTNHKTTALGIYRAHPAPTRDDPDAEEIQFRPLRDGLSHIEAAALARSFAQSISGNPEQLHAYIAGISAMEVEEQTQLVEQIQQEERVREHSFDIDR